MKYFVFAAFYTFTLTALVMAIIQYITRLEFR